LTEQLWARDAELAAARQKDTMARAATEERFEHFILFILNSKPKP